MSYHGVRLPVSAQAGPRDNAYGLASGYSDTPLGALLAAVNIGVRTSWVLGPDIFQPTIHLQVTGPFEAASLDPSAPGQAREIVTSLVASAPASTADVDTRVSLTFDPSASPANPRTTAEAVAEVGRVLHGLQLQLGSCGVAVTGRCHAADITGIVRAAYDPVTRGEVSRVLSEGSADDLRLAWPNAGPGGADELWDRYQHDSGVSVSWAWREAPRQNVHADVLARVTAPGAWAKRVTLQYRPLPAVAATRVLENEVRAAEFRAEYARRTHRDATARDTFDHARARQAAMEEAQGAGVALVSLYLTVTAASDEDLPRAIAAGLPCGVSLPDLARRSLR